MAAAVGGAGWAVMSAWQMVAEAGADTLAALWLIPPLMALHAGQLLLSAVAWRTLLPEPPASAALFLRWRMVREGIDSLLPVAQVGGELVTARLLARRGVPPALAAAVVVVDVTVEFLAQIAYLAIALAVWVALAPAAAWGAWFGVGVLSAAMAGGLIAAQRLGLLRLIEALTRQIAARFPTMANLSLDGLHQAATMLYRRRGPIAGSFALHLLSWALGTIEAWAVLDTVGAGVSWPVAFVLESLGMAARSAGFAVPGALVVQETGFVLAAVALGLPEQAGLAVSLVKRLREIATGLIGLALWRTGGR